MATAAHAHASPIPPATEWQPGQPLRCVKCGGALRLVGGESDVVDGIPVVAATAPAPAPRVKELLSASLRTCGGEILRIPGERGRPPVECARCRGEAAGA